VPDLPGCFSAGDTLDKAIENAKESIELWLETVIDDGGEVPEPGSIAVHQANPDLLAGYGRWFRLTLQNSLIKLIG
jgi:predicted RNase H-like HicB family nuclease